MPTQSLDPEQYLSDAIDIIQENALNSKYVDWQEVRATALTVEKNAKTPADTYDTISTEATAISFQGRPNTCFFGQPSSGLTTANSAFPLADGATIILTVATELDRTGQEYGDKILPNVETSDPQSDAITWLLNQPACQK